MGNSVSSKKRAEVKHWLKSSDSNQNFVAGGLAAQCDIGGCPPTYVQAAMAYDEENPPGLIENLMDQDVYPRSMMAQNIYMPIYSSGTTSRGTLTGLDTSGAYVPFIYTNPITHKTWSINFYTGQISVTNPKNGHTRTFYLSQSQLNSFKNIASNVVINQPKYPPNPVYTQAPRIDRFASGISMEPISDYDDYEIGAGDGYIVPY